MIRFTIKRSFLCVTYLLYLTPLKNQPYCYKYTPSEKKSKDNVLNNNGSAMGTNSTHCHYESVHTMIDAISMKLIKMRKDKLTNKKSSLLKGYHGII